jgi:D-lyxose ketol-isomerase
MKRSEINHLILSASQYFEDLNDNFLINPEIGRYPGIEKNEPPLVRLLGERVT